VVNIHILLQTPCRLVGCNQRFTERYTTMFRVQFPLSGQGQSSLTRRHNKTTAISLSFNSPPANSRSETAYADQITVTLWRLVLVTTAPPGLITAQQPYILPTQYTYFIAITQKLFPCIEFAD